MFLLFSLYCTIEPISIKVNLCSVYRLLKCGQISSLLQSVYKTELGRVKMNRNYNRNRPVKPE